MTTIETKSRIALLLTLTATAGVQRAAYADSSAGGQVEAVTSARSRLRRRSRRRTLPCATRCRGSSDR